MRKRRGHIAWYSQTWRDTGWLLGIAYFFTGTFIVTAIVLMLKLFAL